MSIIVKGMKMPENCRECPFENYYSDTGKTVCMASLRVLAIGFGIISFDGRHSSCPLVALPDKHGRLVDADEMLNRLQAWNTSDRMDKALYNFTWHRIMEQPTIVESEDSE